LLFGDTFAMTHLTTDNLTKILDLLPSRPNWSKTMASIGAHERLAFNWGARSAKAEKDDDRASPFFLEWNGSWDFWHRHAARARIQNIALYEAQLRDEAMNGRETVVLGPDQKPVWRERAEYIGKSDEWIMISEGCSEADVKWHRLEHDAKGRPLPLTKIEYPPAPVRLRILEQDKRYIESKNLDVNVSGEIAHSKPLARLPGEQRPDVEHLRALAAMSPEDRRAALGASGVALDEHGRRTIPRLAPPMDARTDDAGRGLRHPAPGYFAPPKKPPEPAPSYARPPQSSGDDHYGSGTVSGGGYKVR
jgi:hypothetical protein